MGETMVTLIKLQTLKEERRMKQEAKHNTAKTGLNKSCMSGVSKKSFNRATKAKQRIEDRTLKLSNIVNQESSSDSFSEENETETFDELVGQRMTLKTEESEPFRFKHNSWQRKPQMNTKS